MWKNIIFDLDGTLIDSADDIIDCLYYAYSFVPELGVPKIEKTIIGPPVDTMAKRITPNINDQQIQRIVSKYRGCYDKSTLPRTKLYAGVEKLLNTLTAKGLSLFLVTNKPIFPTKMILKKFSLNCFTDIITPDSISGKTINKDEMIQCLIKKWALEKGKTLIVGDTSSDVQAGNKNGIISAAVLNGYGEEHTIRNSRPKYIFKDINELADKLFKEEINE